VRLVLLGVRGSTPAPGAGFVRYGGHTSCVAVCADGRSAPSLVLDAGTGLRDLGRLLDGRPFRGTVVLSHLHWDHVQGLPFSPAVDHPDARVDLFVPGSPDDCDAPRQLLARAMSPPHFPIGPEGLLGQWRFLAARPGVLPATMTGPEGSPAPAVTVAQIPHKGGVTLGIRVELAGVSAAYLPDHVCDPVAGEPDQAAAEALVAGVDVLLHDGQFRQEERERAIGYGHSTIEDALAFADRCRVGRLVLVHHAPHRTDAELDALAAAVTATPGGRPVTFAREGDAVDVRAPARSVAARPDSRPDGRPDSRPDSTSQTSHRRRVS
jgi:ribonuclease BN (tRNA processing enzyme)